VSSLVDENEQVCERQTKELSQRPLTQTCSFSSTREDTEENKRPAQAQQLAHGDIVNS
jgi:hypothetical protein